MGSTSRIGPTHCEPSAGNRPELAVQSVRKREPIYLLVSDVEVKGTGNSLASNQIVGTTVIIYGDRNVIENNLFSGYPYYFGLTLFGSDNVYRGNIARGNNGEPGDCSNPSATTDFCDEGANNTSHGDNYMPGQM
jgi:hypothetical protein